MVEKNRMITYIPYQHSIKAILLFAFLLQCCQSHPHAFEEAMSAQEASSASDVQQQSSSEVALDPIVILSAFSLDECILPAHRASGTAGAPVQSTPSIFTASSGESVQFIQLDAQWHAVVLDDKTQMVSQRTLPVRSGDKDIDRLIAQLQLLDKRSAKTRIHVLQKNYSPERTACVYLGQLGLLGGMPKNKRLQEEGIVERKLLRAAMRQPANLSTEQEGEITAAKSDAILGRNGPTKGDRKGSFYEQLIDELWGEYASIPLIEKGDFVVNKVINPVRKQGGRFMRWDSNKNQYRVMEEREEREIAKTVMQALRDRHKSTPEKPKKRPSAQGIECTPPLRQEANCPEQDCMPLGMSITELPYWQGYAEAPGQQADCPEQDCKPFGMSTTELPYWQGYEEAPDQQAHYSEQDSKPPAIDSLHGKKQGIIQPEQPMYTFTLRPENLVPQRTNDESRMGLSSGMPKNKRQQEKSMAEHKLLRAAQQSVNLSTEQESGVTITKEDATLGHMGPTKGDRKESFYKQLIDVLWDDYDSIPLTEKWKFVVDKVINPIHGQGGRFVRWDADKQQYRVMEGEEITEKVMQALRTRRKNTPGKPKEGTCAQGIEYAQPLRQGANCSEQDCDPFGVSTVASSHGQERGKSPERQTHYSRQDLELFGVSTAELSYLRELAPAEALYRQDKYLGQDSESFGVPNAVFPYRQKYEETPNQQANNCPEQDGKLSAIDSLHRKRQDVLQPKHPIYTLQLRDSDAILGCNGPTKADRKGSFYEQLIHVLWDDYSRIPLTEKEDFAVNRVINPVRKQNGRFMRWDTNKKQYRVMEESEEKEIAKTVMQALRDRRKNMPRKYKGETYAQGIEHILPLRQEASCPERDLEPLGMATPELPHGQGQAKLPDQQPSCPEQDLEPLGVSDPELPHM